MTDRNEIKITEARERGTEKRKRLQKRNLTVLAMGIALLLLLILGIRGCQNKEVEETEEKKEKVTTEETQTQEETKRELTVQAYEVDADEAKVVEGFYQTYLLSESLDMLGKYIDTTEGIEQSVLSMHKKYIEQVSDIKCYPIKGADVDENYLTLMVTYKIKLYNYAELLPSIDVLFLVNGDEGYRVHNMTTADVFERDKLLGDENFQILSEQVATELQGLLAANAELNNVYNLYLNPQQGQE